MICHVSEIPPLALQWTKFSIIGHSMGESHTMQTKENKNNTPDSLILTLHGAAHLVKGPD